MDLSIYFNREEIEVGQRSQIEFSSTGPVNEYFGLEKYNGGGLVMFGFKNGLIADNSASEEDAHVTVLVNMLIPYYFENIGSTDIHGLILMQLGPRPAANNFLKDLLRLGRFGCPKRIIMTLDNSSARRDHFKFNRMRFYPFLMPDLTVGYYVCDEATTSLHWPAYSQNERGVALEFPLAYDATLGLFMTRSAHIA